jgi:SAM-dependent methyltransferase
MGFRQRKSSGNFVQDSSNKRYQGQNELESSESGLKRYSDSIASNLLSELTLKNSKNVIVDFGAGTGQIATLVQEKTSISPICIEIDSALIAKLENRDFQTFSSINNEKVPFATLIYSSNVLEHIEDDVEVLINIYNKLLPNGLVAIFVPAFPFLFSDFDHQVGHYRRYTKKELKEKVTMAGFEIVTLKYFDSLGIITWWLMKQIGIRPNSKNGISLLMSIYDNLVFPISRIIDFCGFSRIAGKNLILIGRKGVSLNGKNNPSA